MIFVTKFDGRKQLFDRGKIIRTCLRLQATQQQAEKIADKIEKKIYNGIKTKKIFQMILRYLAEFKPAAKYQIDLREAIALLRPKPDFEQFIALLLKEYGYEIESNKLVRGKCVEHEIDAIARKGSDIVFVEVKHHLQPHTYTGIGVFLEAQATFEDLVAGYQKGFHKYNFTKALVVCNTKISDQAKQYAACIGIEHLGWKFPIDVGLEIMIERKKLYPITYMKELDRLAQQKLGDNGIVILKQLLQYDIELLHNKTRIPMEKLKFLMRAAREIIPTI